MKIAGMILAGLGLLVPLAANAIPVVEVRPYSQGVTVGESFGIDVVVSGLAGELVGAYDLTVGWDSSLLAFATTTFDVYLDDPFSIQGVIAAASSVNVSEVSLDLLANQVGLTEFRLFRLTFTPLGVGQSPIDLLGGMMTNFAGAELQFTSVSGSANILARPVGVPEPGTLALLVLGLAGLGLGRRHKV